MIGAGNDDGEEPLKKKSPRKVMELSPRKVNTDDAAIESAMKEMKAVVAAMPVADGDGEGEEEQ